MDKLIAQSQNQSNNKAPKKNIPVTAFTYHGPQGDELRYKDKSGKVYNENPND
jgi:hypothetical protein